MSPIKEFSVTCEAVNEDDTFSPGDTIAGMVTFRLTKDTKVKRLFVKAKGDANVHWTEGSGDDEKSYDAHRRYFKLKEYLVPETSKATVLPQGVHCFKFRFTIPEEDMPSSFKGSSGKIVYKLEAKLSRSWRWPSTADKKIDFVSKTFPHIGQIMCPQSGSVSKEMGRFSSGQVHMFATVNRKVCSPGDTLSAVAKISNSSSKTMKPKFRLLEKIVYRAEGNTNTSEKTRFKMVGDTMAPGSEETVSCQVKIPDDTMFTLHNCDIISVEHLLKVYLDISFAFDPEVVFPLVVVPSSVVARQLSEDMGPYPPVSVQGPSCSDFPPPALPVGLVPAPAGPTGACAYPASNPTHAVPYNFSKATVPPSLAQPSAPTAPPQLPQEDEPPSYTSLFLPLQDPLGRGETDHKS